MLEVGVALVSRFGAKALSLTSVARQAGVARATAYRMFGGRDALVEALVAHELDLLRQNLREWGVDEPDIAAKLRTRTLRSLEYIRQHQAIQYVLRNEPEEIVRALVTTTESSGPTLVDMVVDVSLADLDDSETASLSPDPRVAMEFVVRAAYSYLLVPDGAMTDDQFADLVVRAVVR